MKYKSLFHFLCISLLVSTVPTHDNLKNQVSIDQLDHLKTLEQLQKPHFDTELAQYFKENSGTGYMKFSHVLLGATSTIVRGNRDDEPMTCAEAETYISRAHKMNRAILDSPSLIEPLTVYRSLSYAAESKQQVLLKYLSVGAIVPVTHFTSTSITTDMGRNFLSDEYMLKIDLPQGFPVKIILGESEFASEREILLPFTLDKTGKTANYGFRVVKVDEEPTKVFHRVGHLMKEVRFIHLEVVELQSPIPLDSSKIPCVETLPVLKTVVKVPVMKSRKGKSILDYYK